MSFYQINVTTALLRYLFIYLYMFRNMHKIWVRNILLLVVGSDELIAGSLSQSMPIDEMQKNVDVTHL